jgi:hypothetical protein
MNDLTETSLSKIHRLATAQLEGGLSDREQVELAELLRSGPEARRTYLAYMGDTVSLRWIYSGHYQRSPEPTLSLEAARDTLAARPPRRFVKWAALAAAAALAGVMLAGSYAAKSISRSHAGADRSAASARTAVEKPKPPIVATLSQASAVDWNDGVKRPPLLSRVSVGDKLTFGAGTVELTFDTGAKVRVFGPAAIEISSPMSILCLRGRVNALVGETGKGFTIDTPKARIVDLGTQFGVNISERGDTEVVVFQGSVDLTQTKGEDPLQRSGVQRSGIQRRRLYQGDALRVSDYDQAQRLVAVQRGDFFPSSAADPFGLRRAPLIEDVRDNIRAGESTKCYQIVRGGLREDAPSFVDRMHQWNGVDAAGLPSFLLGADYVMPFNDDKFISDLRVDLQIARPAVCYVFLDDNMPAPDWLREGFQDTGRKIGLDGAKTIWHKKNKLGAGPGASVDFVFSVWRREVTQPGVVSFGGVTPPDQKRSRGFNMYGIAVAPK